MSFKSCYERFCSLFPSSEIQKLQKKGSHKKGIFTTSVVTWLMMFQRLEGGSSLSEAVLSVALGQWKDLNKNRVRREISESTGGYSQARYKLSVKQAEAIADKVFEELAETSDNLMFGKRLLSMDGTTIKIAATDENRKQYPPGRNKYGVSKRGLLHTVVVHDLISGYAARPAYGAFYGDTIATEGMLLRELLSRLPQNAVMIGDSGFGIFSVVHDVIKSDRAVIVRLNGPRGKKVLGKEPRSGVDRTICWEASDYDRKTNPSIAKGTKVNGRVITERVQTRDGKKVLLILFTTLLDAPVADIISAYGLRWNIETDLRTLKKVVNLDYISAKNPAMVAKELLMGIAAYNLVRSTIEETAEELGISPRELSFSQVLRIIRYCMPAIAEAKNAKERDELLKKFIHLTKRAKLPKRKSRNRDFINENWQEIAK